jgi:Cytochrome C oxidase, cbb3-type, subunit III
MGFLRLPVVLGVIALFVALRLAKARTLAWTGAVWFGVYSLARFAFNVPIPASVVFIYMFIVTLALLAYVTSSAQRRAEAAGPIVALVNDPKYRLVLAPILVLLPALAAANVYFGSREKLEAPAFGRTVHPAPPDSISVHDKTVDLAKGHNPFRELEKTDPAAFKMHVENGRKTYYQNCFFCHGDALAGDGMFIHGLNPIPTNFTDKGTIAQLQESFLFWRISKGGPGLPAEGGPWDSAMPAWEKFLKEDDIWDVILFLYDYTGQRPRASGEEHK